MILALLNIASVPGQILTGALCDRIEYWQVMLGSALISIVAIFALLRVGDTFPKVAGFAVLLGLTVSDLSLLLSPTTVEHSAPNHRRAASPPPGFPPPSTSAPMQPSVPPPLKPPLYSATSPLREDSLV